MTADDAPRLELVKCECPPGSDHVHREGIYGCDDLWCPCLGFWRAVPDPPE